MSKILATLKRVFSSYYITCTSTHEKIRVYSKEDMSKHKFCPFCGFPMRWRGESDEEYSQMLREQITALRGEIVKISRGKEEVS